MLNAKRRRWGDGQNSSGGPGGAPMQPGPVEDPPFQLDRATASIVQDVYLRGGAVRMVPMLRAVPMAQLIKLRQAGIITTEQDVRGATTASLTPRGLQHVVEADRILRETSAPSP